jgi:hypothetical protein
VDKKDEKPWWFPVLADETWIARLRIDYPDETEGLSDEDVSDKYSDGWKYTDTWDHLGDAREEHEKLADAYLELLARVGNDG